MSDGRDHLSALDATFLELEQADEGATMHIGGVVVFDPLPGGGTPTLEAIRATIAERLARIPRYSQRLSSTRTGGLSWPSWTDDKRFDVRNHILHAALPSPGGEQELCEWAGEFSRTAWTGRVRCGRWCCWRGSRKGAGRSRRSPPLDGRRRRIGRGRATAFRRRPGGRRGATARARRAGCAWDTEPPGESGQLSGALGTVGRTASSTLHAALHPRETPEIPRARGGARLERDLGFAPHDAQRPDRRDPPFRRGANQPLGRQSDGHELGGSVNDVLLAACTAGVRELMLSRGERPPAAGVRAMAPMNIRYAGEQLSLGNRISSLFVDLPVAAEEQAALQAGTEQTQRLKSSRAALGADDARRGRSRAARAALGDRARAVRDPALQHHDHQRPRPAGAAVRAEGAAARRLPAGPARRRALDRHRDAPTWTRSRSG